MKRYCIVRKDSKRTDASHIHFAKQEEAESFCRHIDPEGKTFEVAQVLSEARRTKVD